MLHSPIWPTLLEFKVVTTGHWRFTSQVTHHFSKVMPSENTEKHRATGVRTEKRRRQDRTKLKHNQRNVGWSLSKKRRGKAGIAMAVLHS